MPMSRLRRFWASYRLSRLSADVRQRAVFVVKMACLVRCFREYGIDLTLCVGPSMLPTFNEKGDLVLLEHYSVYAERIQPGDVVVARSAQTPRYIVCKRVLGLEGDSVRVRPATGTDLPHTTIVPKGHVWLQGDNAINSTDSRHYGPVPFALLQGRVFLKIWPLHEIGYVKNEVPASAT